MNNKILYLFLSLAMLLVTSCSDKFLENMKSYNNYDASLFTNQTETGWFLDNIYYNYFSGYNSPIKTVVGLYSNDQTYMTEEIGGTINNLINPTMTLNTAASCSTYFGSALTSSVNNNPYTRIRNCNFLIDTINYMGSNLPETFRQEVRGQAFFLRALQYFDLVRTYGGVPLVLHLISPSATNTSIRYPRATTSECVTQIVNDLDSAANLLPTSWSSSTDYGRFTKGAALAEISRVLLTYASPLFNTDWDNTSDSRWQAALAAGLAAEKECSADGYGLYGSSAKDWANMFVSSAGYKKEGIIVFQCSSSSTPSAEINNQWENSIRLKSQGGSGGIAVPKEMIDLFPMANGTRPTVADGYNDSLFFLNRDPRFYRTFAFSGCKWANKANANSVVWAYRYVNSKGAYTYHGNNQLKSPCFVRKMSDPSADSTAFSYSGTPIMEYRYAELILNIAECYAATGDLSDCLTYLERIRARVGIPSANNYGLGTFTDKYQAIAACLYERQVELAYEGKRFWDIQRWMLFNDDASSGNNTCAKLGLTPLDQTTRVGDYWQAKTVSNTDPVASAINTISIDPDASNFTQELNSLATLYNTYFVRVAASPAMDTYNNQTLTQFGWQQNYYIQGLPTTVLTNNPWLLQTKGWYDAYGSQGTFDYQQ
ncbi:RagB/SusD family nutrient uptake outer membrane protein [Microbacter margulisiae]|uniref:Starch-binding associating with outer membrane n=1 Tax=Microbacter margulisiae TaxID=1350067 RepID=A0A7W5DQ60_9PORP|nr:RagB/SusD family nutrient uptake outer membrane protein [Microbacter margulisiae]MBB3186986.1 hypothetical protein [Microbacter margulisiae]